MCAYLFRCRTPPPQIMCSHVSSQKSVSSLICADCFGVGKFSFKLMNALLCALCDVPLARFCVFTISLASSEAKASTFLAASHTQ